jgi:hypothetical protein
MEPITLYDSGFGPLSPEGIKGSSLEFRRDGTFHQSVFGDNFRFSWDIDKSGNISKDHFIDQDYPKGDPRRYPFGR